MVIFLFTSFGFLILGTYLWCAVVVTSPIGALVCWNYLLSGGLAIP